MSLTDSLPEKFYHQQNEQAWDLTARHKYADDVANAVALLRAGQTNLLPEEIALLQAIVPTCQRVIHLQCSHGLDALSLWQMGAGGLATVVARVMSVIAVK